MEYKDFSDKIKFYKTEGIYVREAYGFILYLKDWQYLVMNIQSIYIPVDKSISKEEIKKIEQAALNNACSTTSFNEKDDCLIISLPDGKKNEEKFVDECEKIIKRVTKLLSIDGYKPMSICPICKQNAEFRAFGDDYIPMHEECIEKHKNELIEKVELEKKFDIKNIYSLLLSLLFACIGLTPALLLCIFKKDYFTGLVALVPVLCVLGYFLVKSSSKKWLKIATAVIPMVIIIAFTIFAFCYIINTSEDYTFLSFTFSGAWIGFRKIIFSLILCFGGFGGVKFLEKFKKNYSKELEKFNK